jgi:hypothetical protein
MNTTDLQTFNSDMDRRRALAVATGASPDYLWQLGVGFQNKRPSTDLAQAIDLESGRIWLRVPKESLRSDVWTDKTK